MKFLFSVTLLIISVSGFGQIKTDTIYVSTTQPAYLVFPDVVDFIDIGNKTQYISTIEGKTVFLKAKSENAEGTRYLVKTGDNYYQGVLLYSPKVVKNFFDFRSIETTVITTTEVKTKVKTDKEKNEEPLDTTKLLIKEALLSFKTASTNKYKTYGTLLDNQIYFELSDIRHNKEGSFIKMHIKNLSSIPYIIDHVDFEIYESKTILRNELTIMIEDVPRQVSSKEDAYLFFAFSPISVAENCDLKITLREREGIRTVVVYINSKVIANALTF